MKNVILWSAATCQECDFHKEDHEKGAKDLAYEHVKRTKHKVELLTTSIIQTS